MIPIAQRCEQALARLARGQAVGSPCVGVCTLDTSGSVCTGCLRNLAEIGGWSQFSEAERAQVWRALPARLTRVL